ncbi:MAG: hypothetical protein RLY16_2472 [Bacteroidota bacterium]|jgi:TolA-binding protein
MADSKVTVENIEANETVEKVKDFWSKFSKPIIFIGLAVIVLGGGYLAYKNLYKLPNEEKAADLIFPAEKIFDKMTQTGFNKDSINIVLNGDKGSITGMLTVISKYGGTDAGNRAHYIAGACYLHSKDFNNAIKHLKDFSTPATQVQTVAYLMLGDAHAELNKNEEALSYFQKAIGVNSKDEFMTAEALYKAALFAEATNKTKEATEWYQKIVNDFPKSAHVSDADKALAKLGIVK